MIIFRLNSSEGAVVFLDIHGNEETRRNCSLIALQFIFENTSNLYCMNLMNKLKASHEF